MGRRVNGVVRHDGTQHRPNDRGHLAAHDEWDKPKLMEEQRRHRRLAGYSACTIMAVRARTSVNGIQRFCRHATKHSIPYGARSTLKRAPGRERAAKKEKRITRERVKNSSESGD